MDAHGMWKSTSSLMDGIDTFSCYNWQVTFRGEGNKELHFGKRNCCLAKGVDICAAARFRK